MRKRSVIVIQTTVMIMGTAVGRDGRTVLSPIE